MEEVKHILVFVDLDQTVLALLLVTVVLIMLVCSVSLTREEGSIEHFCLGRFDSALSAQSYTYLPPNTTSSQTSPSY